MKKNLSSLFLSSLTLGLCLSLMGCSSDDKKKPSSIPPPSQQMDFGDGDGDYQTPTHPLNPQDNAGGALEAVPSVDHLIVTNISLAEDARYLGVGIEIVVAEGEIMSAADPLVKAAFLAGKPLCILKFDSAASLNHLFQLKNESIDDTGDHFATEYSFEDEEQNALSIQCLSQDRMTPALLQKTYQGLLQLQPKKQ